MVGIYKITSPTGRIYIGQSWDIKNRMRQYASLFSAKGQRLLYKSILKYGFSSHKNEVVHELPKDTTQNVLDELEIFCIAQYREAGAPCLNLRSGGSKGKHLEETKARLSASKMGNTVNVGKKYSEERKAKIRQKHLGKVLDSDHRLKLSRAHKGKTISAETKTKLSAALTGRIHSAEAIDRMSKAKKGIPSKRKGQSLTSAHKQNIGNARRGITAPAESYARGWQTRRKNSTNGIQK